MLEERESQRQEQLRGATTAAKAISTELNRKQYNK